MRHPFFKTILSGGLIGGVIVSLFLIILSFIYKDPLNSTPKSLDLLLYIGLPVVTAVYYKRKVNNGLLDFTEGLVVVSLSNLIMLLLACLTLWLILVVNEDILKNNIASLINQYTTQKEEVMKRLQSEKDYENLLARTHLRDVGTILFEEAGFKLIIGFMTSIVAATALRKYPNTPR